MMEEMTKAQKLTQLAENADVDFDFSLAYRLFIQASLEFDKIQDTNQARQFRCLDDNEGFRH